jgi:hypothetical protein
VHKQLNSTWINKINYKMQISEGKSIIKAFFTFGELKSSFFVFSESFSETN